GDPTQARRGGSWLALLLWAGLVFERQLRIRIEFRAFAACFIQLFLGEAGRAAQVGIAQVGVAQVGIAEFGAPQLGAQQVGAAQVGAADGVRRRARPAQVSTA